MKVNIHFKGRRSNLVVDTKIVTFKEVAGEDGSVKIYAFFAEAGDEVPIGSVDIRAIDSITDS